VKAISLRHGIQRSPQYLRVNPMGRVPALRDSEVIVSESPAICIYLADRYSLGTLAPALDGPRRGDYLRWMVFSTAAFEPAIYLPEDDDPQASMGRGWGNRNRVLDVLDKTLSASPGLLGEQFSAADVMLGSLISVALFNDRIAQPPRSLLVYKQSLMGRPAYRRAAEATWPTATGVGK
jgi:glutathione S-transferase